MIRGGESYTPGTFLQREEMNRYTLAFCGKATFESMAKFKTGVRDASVGRLGNR